MKLYCPLSGISYKTNIGYGHGKAPHPIFYLPLKALVSQHLDSFVEGKLTEAETHLFGCALLHKLPVVWDEVIPLNEQTVRQWRKSIEKLAGVALRYDTRHAADLPQYHIDKRSNSLSNLNQYLNSLAEAHAELAFMGSESPALQQNAEETLLRMIRQVLNKNEKKNSLPQLMAEWAADVGEFPTETFRTIDGRRFTISEHWQHIIIKAFKTTNYTEILSEDISLGDVDELIEHCETNIEVGTLHSLTLMRKLRDVRAVLEEFRSPAPRDTITVADHSDLAAMLLEDTNGTPTVSASLVTTYPTKPYTAPAASQDITPAANDESNESNESNVPDSPPIRAHYKTTAEFISARIRYAKKHKQQGAK